jgi:hypothetical protein
MPKRLPNIKGLSLFTLRWRGLLPRREGQLVQPAEIENTFADMLRYDSAFAHAERAGVILVPKLNYPGRGATIGRPTPARWESFSGHIEPSGVTPPSTRSCLSRTSGSPIGTRTVPTSSCAARSPRSCPPRSNCPRGQTEFQEDSMAKLLEWTISASTPHILPDNDDELRAVFDPIEDDERLELLLDSVKLRLESLFPASWEVAVRVKR